MPHESEQMNNMRRFLTILLTVFVYSCVPYSDTPLTDPGKEKIDVSICGTWSWIGDCEPSYVHIGFEEISKQLGIIVVNFDKNGEIGLSKFSGHTSLLKKNRYLNLKLIRSEDEMPGYIFLKYRVTKKILEISIMDSTAIEKAIIDGLIKGEVKNEGSLFVKITESQKKLQKFIIQNDNKLFGKMIKLKRVKPHTCGKVKPVE